MKPGYQPNLSRLLIIALLFLGAAVIACAQNTGEDVWEALREGGNVVLMRHTIAPGGGDPPGFRLDDCATQRNLSNEGRQQARSIGRAFRRRAIPVDRVLTSQWCRCRETAELLQLSAVEEYPVLNSFFSDRSTAGRQTRDLRRFIGTLDLRGNIVLVTHQVNITELTGVFPASGEMVVVRPDGQNEFQLVGRLKTDS
jgi:phosphohistidine phosphatase SixA